MAEETLRFPIEDQDYYQGRVIFQVREETPPDIGFSSGSAAVRNAIAKSGLSESEKEEIEPDNGSIFTGRDPRSSGNSKVTLGRRAVLYLPRGIQMNDGVDYERADLGRIGGTAEAATQNGGSLLGVATKATMDTLSSVNDLFTQAATPDAARFATSRAASLLNTDFGNGVRSALRVATNPNSRQLFREVYFREFTFTFKMIPTTKEEAEVSKQLIKFFRTELYPEDSVRVDVGGASIPIAYRFPNTFDIRFKHKNQPIIHRLLPCYLKTISTNYNPTGPGFFEDGNFSEIEITLTFTESRTLTKGLVRDGGY